MAITFGLASTRTSVISAEDRAENIRRVGEVSKLFVDAGIIVLSSFISPYLVDRQLVREMP